MYVYIPVTLCQKINKLQKKTNMFQNTIKKTFSGVSNRTVYIRFYNLIFSNILPLGIDFLSEIAAKMQNPTRNPKYQTFSRCSKLNNQI